MKAQRLSVGLLATVLATAGAAGGEVPFRSHAPMRPLPTAVQRPLDKGVHYFVDPAKGDDRNDGARSSPWKSIQRGVKELKPGDTLVLRGGVYYEHVTIAVAGTEAKPITIRSHPGELPILDGGLREFFDNPAAAWEPCPDGAPGEFRSTRTYPDLGGIVLGNFGDSLIPLHGYRSLADLRSRNEYWPAKRGDPMYCGPGLWYDAKTGRIHIRLAHTTLPILGDDNYRGETDPRKLPLMIGRPQPVLTIERARFVRVHDLVVRGSSGPTVVIAEAASIELDGVTIFGGARALAVRDTSRLKLVNCALRGIASPWSSRGHHKYRGVPAYLLMIRGQCPDGEIAYCELTDSHDGPFIGPARRLRFHRNFVDNFNDDGIYLTAMGVGGDVHVYQNVLSRCLHIFAYYGTFKPGAGTHVYRNLIDMRRPVYYGWPSGPNDPQYQGKDRRPSFPAAGWLCGDHGSPIWEPLHFYHNTVISQSQGESRGYYAAGWGGHTAGSPRRVFNNIFVQADGVPGLNFTALSVDDDFQSDGNFFWGLRDGPAHRGDFFAAFRKTAKFSQSKKRYPPGWGANDLFADPKFVRLDGDWRKPFDPRLQRTSLAIDAGVPLPVTWPDPLRKLDAGLPDIGAFPAGTQPLRVGVRGRLSFGESENVK
ncbi:MAG: hypothetical protein FJ271_27545 [Planctomycetes bacterium]|nr:hypothetical protein [Planctomycetota bacterium]